jgi:hypothetical protein
MVAKLGDIEIRVTLEPATSRIGDLTLAIKFGDPGTEATILIRHAQSMPDTRANIQDDVLRWRKRFRTRQYDLKGESSRLNWAALVMSGLLPGGGCGEDIPDGPLRANAQSRCAPARCAGARAERPEGS